MMPLHIIGEMHLYGPRPEGQKDWTRAIKTHYEMPPIPNADHWRAYDDNLGADCSPYGEGATEQEAIDDLMAQLEEMETPT